MMAVSSNPIVGGTDVTGVSKREVHEPPAGTRLIVPRTVACPVSLQPWLKLQVSMDPCSSYVFLKWSRGTLRNMRSTVDDCECAICSVQDLADSKGLTPSEFSRSVSELICSAGV